MLSVQRLLERGRVCLISKCLPGTLGAGIVYRVRPRRATADACDFDAPRARRSMLVDHAQRDQRSQRLNLPAEAFSPYRVLGFGFRVKMDFMVVEFEKQSSDLQGDVEARVASWTAKVFELRECVLADHDVKSNTRSRIPSANLSKLRVASI